VLDAPSWPEPPSGRGSSAGPGRLRRRLPSRVVSRDYGQKKRNRCWRIVRTRLTLIGCGSLVRERLERPPPGRNPRVGSIQPILFHLRCGDHPIASGTQRGDPDLRRRRCRSAQGAPLAARVARSRSRRGGGAGPVPTQKTITPFSPTRWKYIGHASAMPDRCQRRPVLTSTSARIRPDSAASRRLRRKQFGGLGPSITPWSVKRRLPLSTFTRRKRAPPPGDRQRRGGDVAQHG